MKGSTREQWGRLTEADVEWIGGERDRLVGKLQERYGLARVQAQRRADEWVEALGIWHAAGTNTFTGSA
jgi:uncharacterized protein YjbJ (UPF0337 family)